LWGPRGYYFLTRPPQAQATSISRAPGRPPQACFVLFQIFTEYSQALESPSAECLSLVGSGWRCSWERSAAAEEIMITMENLLYRDRPHFHFQAPVGYPSHAGRKPLEARCVSFFRIPPSLAGLINFVHDRPYPTPRCDGSGQLRLSAAAAAGERHAPTSSAETSSSRKLGRAARGGAWTCSQASKMSVIARRSSLWTTRTRDASPTSASEHLYPLKFQAALRTRGRDPRQRRQ